MEPKTEIEHLLYQNNHIKVVGIEYYSLSLKKQNRYEKVSDELRKKLNLPAGEELYYNKKYYLGFNDVSFDYEIKKIDLVRANSKSCVIKIKYSKDGCSYETTFTVDNVEVHESTGQFNYYAHGITNEEFSDIEKFILEMVKDYMNKLKKQAYTVGEYSKIHASQYRELMKRFLTECDNQSEKTEKAVTAFGQQIKKAL